MDPNVEQQKTHQHDEKITTSGRGSSISNGHEEQQSENNGFALHGKGGFPNEPWRSQKRNQLLRRVFSCS